jgi:hypothetical protein
MGSVTSWSRSAQGSSPRPSTKGALFKPLTSWVWGLRCWWNPPVRFRAAGFGFLGEGVFGFVGEVVAEQDGEGFGEVPERHFGDTAADSAHRMADPEGIRSRRSTTAARVPPDHTRVGRARWPARASVRGGSGGVGLDVGEHAAAVPGREDPDEP